MAKESVTKAFKRASGLADALEKRLNLQLRARRNIFGPKWKPVKRFLYYAMPNGKAASVAGFNPTNEKLKKLEHDDVMCWFGPDDRWRCWAVRGPQSGPLVLIYCYYSGKYYDIVWDIRKNREFTGAKKDDGTAVTWPCKREDYHLWFNKHIEYPTYRTPYKSTKDTGGVSWGAQQDPPWVEPPMTDVYYDKIAVYYTLGGGPSPGWIPKGSTYTYSYSNTKTWPSGEGDASWSFSLTADSQAFNFGGEYDWGPYQKTATIISNASSPMILPSENLIRVSWTGQESRLFWCTGEWENSVSDESSWVLSSPSEITYASENISATTKCTYRYMSPWGILMMATIHYTRTMSRDLTSGTDNIEREWVNDGGFHSIHGGSAATDTTYLTYVSCIGTSKGETKTGTLSDGEWHWETDTKPEKKELFVHATAFEISDYKLGRFFAPRNSSLEKAYKKLGNAFGSLVSPYMQLAQLKS